VSVWRAPSANRFGAVSPTTAQHVLHDLGERLDPRRDVILDGGPCPIGVESTIVDCAERPPTDPARRRRARRGRPPSAGRGGHRRIGAESGQRDAGVALRAAVRLCAWSTPPTTRSRCAPARSAPRSSTSPTISSSTHESSTPVSATPTTAGGHPDRGPAPCGRTRTCDPRSPDESGSSPAGVQGQSTALRLATQASRTSITSGVGAPSMPATGQAHRRCAGIGHHLQPAPAVERRVQVGVETVGRVVIEHLSQPRCDDEHRLEGLHRQGLHRERRCVTGDARRPVLGRDGARWRGAQRRPPR
jgi:hypothetical protein